METSSFAVLYRRFLRDELERRRQHNPRYSLRAFARDLGLSPSRLFDVMNGRYGFSSAAAEAVAQRVGLRDSAAQMFRCVVECAHARARSKRQDALERLQQGWPATYETPEVPAAAELRDALERILSGPQTDGSPGA